MIPYLFRFSNNLKQQMLMSFIFFSLVLIDCRYAKSQGLIDSARVSERVFENQGEQEDYWAETLFKNNYKNEHYNIYTEPIVMSGNTYRYKNTILIVDATPELKSIFEKGIVYPGIFTECFKYKHKANDKYEKENLNEKPQIDPSVVMQKYFYNSPNIDTLRITDFEELKFLNISPKQKRFRFLLFTPGFTNPTVYFMELTNKSAGSESGLSSFINGATLTFFEQGWLIM